MAPCFNTQLSGVKTKYKNRQKIKWVWFTWTTKSKTSGRSKAAQQQTNYKMTLAQQLYNQNSVMTAWQPPSHSKAGEPWRI